MKSQRFFLTLGLILTLLMLLQTASVSLGKPLASPCSETNPCDFYLPVVMAPEVSIPVASVLTPFDANVSDAYGPTDWGNNYGKSPEIIVASNGTELDVLAQDYNSATAWKAVLLHIKPTTTANQYTVTQALTQLPMLDRVMGLAVDSTGSRYYATGVDEGSRITRDYPPNNTFRSNIVRVVKLDKNGKVLFNTDLDVARHAVDPYAEMIINPMVAASSRLAVGGSEIALVHGINTTPDGNGTRHQKALSTRLDASTGAVTRTSSVWVSHSFDQRLLYDGEGIIEHHLGDAYPRYIVFARSHESYPLFQIKGGLGDNVTYTRLGNLALIANDPAYRYLAVFATESNSATAEMINGARNLAMVRVKSSDNTVDPNLPDTLTVNSEGETYTNRLKWLTHYSDSSKLHVERPKLVAIGGNRYVVLWEQWTYTGDWWNGDIFHGVYGMVIDAAGSILVPEKKITASAHLPRGDDAFYLNGRAGWMTGSAAGKSLYLHLVDDDLNYQLVTLR